MATPSLKTLREQLDLSPEQAKSLRSKLDFLEIQGSWGSEHARRVSLVLKEADKIIGGHGIETVRGNYHVDDYYDDIVAEYVNVGDGYLPTLLYETETKRFLVTDWASWAEKKSRKYRIR